MSFTCISIKVSVIPSENDRLTAQNNRESGSTTISTDSLAGGIDLHATLASGQSYRWRRRDGDLFEPVTSLPTPWYETVEAGEVICVRQTDQGIEYRGSGDVEGAIRRLLRLDDDLPAILDAGPDHPIYREAIEQHAGMRLVVDGRYIGLISFICSTNMSVERIHEMVQSLMRRYGVEHTFDGRSFYAFPTPESLAAASIEGLRECNLGYRAPYVKETAQAIVDDDPPLFDPAVSGYEETRSHLTAYTGVGPKVADCALLFGDGTLEPVPLDRWIRRAIERHFPECVADSYTDMSRAIRDRLGPYPGYAQTYLFHHLRTIGD